MVTHNLVPQPAAPAAATPGMARALRRREHLEVRSFEAEYVHGLWHLDFHQGSRKVLTAAGTWLTPHLLGVLDDRSRLACHLQWYADETAETLVHGLAQAIQKRGLPRALLTDNGAAMLAAEVQQGLDRLGIVHETTLPYSPYQKGCASYCTSSVGIGGGCQPRGRPAVPQDLLVLVLDRTVQAGGLEQALGLVVEGVGA
jgi:transposase InsO family protein